MILRPQIVRLCCQLNTWNETLIIEEGANTVSSSPTRPCKIGCCGKNGVCSFGPTSCAPDKCESDCDRKSECDPGWGAEWSQKEKCPLNVCCSKYGFCGSTEEFCGSKKVKSPSCSGTRYVHELSSRSHCPAIIPRSTKVILNFSSSSPG